MLWTPVTSDRAGSWLVPRRKARAAASGWRCRWRAAAARRWGRAGRRSGRLLPPRCEVEHVGVLPLQPLRGTGDRPAEQRGDLADGARGPAQRDRHPPLAPDRRGDHGGRLLDVAPSAARVGSRGAGHDVVQLLAGCLVRHAEDERPVGDGAGEGGDVVEHPLPLGDCRPRTATGPCGRRPRGCPRRRRRGCRRSASAAGSLVPHDAGGAVEALGALEVPRLVMGPGDDGVPGVERGDGRGVAAVLDGADDAIHERGGTKPMIRANQMKFAATSDSGPNTSIATMKATTCSMLGLIGRRSPVGVSPNLSGRRCAWVKKVTSRSWGAIRAPQIGSTGCRGRRGC